MMFFKFPIGGKSKVKPGDKPVAPSPLGGFTINGHFLHRVWGSAGAALCGQTVPGPFTMGGGVTCKRCNANIQKWLKRAPTLATSHMQW